MKLATINDGSRDGRLIIVSRDLTQAYNAQHIASNLQQAVEQWDSVKKRMQQIYNLMNAGKQKGTTPLQINALHSPLPRSYQWLDGSAYLSHVKRVRRARNADMPDSFLTDPLMYQGLSDHFLTPYSDIILNDESWGLDYEAELAVIVKDTPQGLNEADAEDAICLLMLVNDISLRQLIPAELAKGFGFLHGKPTSSFGPIAVTPDEFGSDWNSCRLKTEVHSWVNDTLMGHPDASIDMQFGFDQLISHACKTRSLSAGTIIGSGTISNEDQTMGVSCLVEKRVIEIAEHGNPETAFLKTGDQIKIDAIDANGKSLFGCIKQKVIAGDT